MADKPKVRCTVCGEAVVIEKQHIIEHKYKLGSTSPVICYGSFLPVFQDSKGGYHIGNIMYINRSPLFPL